MSLETLNAEVEAYKARKLAAGQPLPDRLDTVPTTAPGDVLPEIMAKVERARAAWVKFCDGCRPQFDAAPDEIACPKHPATMLGKLFEETCQQTRAVGYFKPAYAPCGLCGGEAEKAKQRAFWSRRGVPERVLEATLSSFVADTAEKTDALMSVRDWIKRGGVFLLLLGTHGSGKGHLASGCLKAQGNGRFITHADMLMDLRTSYTLHNTAEVISVWREAEMLVVDEFGVRNEGRDEAALLYQVLANRYDKRRPTIITSNLELPEVREILGPRLVDRVAEDYAVVVMRWESHRRAGK